MNMWQQVRQWLRREAADASEAVHQLEQQLDRDLTERERRLTETPSEAIERTQREIAASESSFDEVRNRIGLTDPDCFVVTTSSYRRFMEHDDLRGEINRSLQLAGGVRPEHLESLSGELAQLIMGAELPQDLERAILEHYRMLEEAFGERIAVAVRSSALDEDVAGASLAGQYRSALDVREEALLSAYKSVVASLYEIPAMSYRMERGLRSEDVSMCVGFLPMIDAVAGGVLYSHNPVDGRDDSIVINSAWGLPKPVVEGRISSDLFLGHAVVLLDADRQLGESEDLVVGQRRTRAVVAGAVQPADLLVRVADQLVGLVGDLPVSDLGWLAASHQEQVARDPSFHHRLGQAPRRVDDDRIVPTVHRVV